MAQLVEQLIRNQQVVGSSPTTSSKKTPRIVGFWALFVFYIYKKPLKCCKFYDEWHNEWHKKSPNL